MAMSTVALPKPSADRPPRVPPTKTTYDGSSSGGDPEFKRIIEYARRLIASVPSWPLDDLERLLKLLQKRKNWIETYLHYANLVERMSLPPSVFSDLTLSAICSEENGPTLQIVQLGHELDALIERVQSRLSLLNSLVKPSDE